MSLLRMSTSSGRVQVIAEDRDDVVVEGAVHTSRSGTTTTVVEVSGRVSARVPIGTDVVVGAESASVRIDGDVGAVAVTTTSGRIEIESATSVDARTSSGRITVGPVSGTARIRVVSGRVEVRGAAGADVASKSGRIELRDIDGPVSAHCVSGRIEIEMVAPHDVEVETMSGRVSVTVPAGTRVHRREGAEDTSPVPADCDCVVQATSLSGRVEVL